MNDLGRESSDSVPNRLDVNDDGEFVSGGALGLDVALYSMGLALGDYDGDGDVDVHVSNAGPTFLARNDGGLFTDVSLDVAALSAGESADVSWSTEFIDLGNDGVSELFTAFGHMPTKGIGGGPGGTRNAYEQRNALWRWSAGDDRFVDVAPERGLDDPAMTRTVVVADLDRDGFPELVTFSLDTGLSLWRAPCNENAWLRVTLRSDSSNRAAIGARVEAIADGQLVVQTVSVGSTGTMSAGPAEVILGLGGADTVDLRVVWPSGRVTENRDVPTRRAVEISEL